MYILLYIQRAVPGVRQSVKKPGGASFVQIELECPAFHRLRCLLTVMPPDETNSLTGITRNSLTDNMRIAEYSAVVLLQSRGENVSNCPCYIPNASPPTHVHHVRTATGILGELALPNTFVTPPRASPRCKEISRNP